MGTESQLHMNIAEEHAGFTYIALTVSSLATARDFVARSGAPPNEAQWLPEHSRRPGQLFLLGRLYDVDRTFKWAIEVREDQK